MFIFHFNERGLRWFWKIPYYVEGYNFLVITPNLTIDVLYVLVVGYLIRKIQQKNPTKIRINIGKSDKLNNVVINVVKGNAFFELSQN